MLKIISKLAKSLEQSFSKPQTYGSGLEYYIVKNNPQNAADIEHLQRQYQYEQQRQGIVWKF